MADRAGSEVADAGWLRGEALALGFDAVGIGPATLPSRAAPALAEAVDKGWHGDMGWLADTALRRADPRTLWPEAQSAVVVAMSYGPASDPMELLDHPARAGISVYARTARDYHDVLKKRLKQLARAWVERGGGAVKVFVDTAPVMEKPLAERAGIGWQGKHSNLVSRRHGSWLFLGVMLTEAALPADAAESDHCGSCRNCLDVCPTDAFPRPYVLEARRCLAYLSIEHKGPIPAEFRVPMANRVFGCDDCLAVCPWNKFADRARESALWPRAELTAPRLADLAALDEAGFRQVFAGSPIKRTGRARFLRNVMIAIGNSADPALLDAARKGLGDHEPLVRGMAVWALGQLLGAAAARTEIADRMADEADAHVRAETDALASGAGLGGS